MVRCGEKVARREQGKEKEEEEEKEEEREYWVNDMEAMMKYYV